MKFLDQFPTYLSNILGSSKVSLNYVIRETAERPPVLPRLQDQVPWSQGHNGLMEELVNYTLHFGPSYTADNAQVYGILANQLAGTNAMASITRHQRNQNGRAAYFDLVTHHMGSAKWEKTVEVAERLLSTRVWNGKNARYSLRFHVNKHREAFNDLDRAKEHIPYVPPNEFSRVRYLLQSIQTTDPTICSAKTTIMADMAKRNDFEEAADFMMITAPEPKPSVKPIHNIAAVTSSSQTNKRKRGKINVGPKTGVEVRFYQRNEWNKLSQDERDECIAIRKEDVKRRKSGNSERKISMTKTQLDQLIASIQTKADGASKSFHFHDDEKDKRPSALKPPRGFTQRKEKNE